MLCVINRRLLCASLLPSILSRCPVAQLVNDLVQLHAGCARSLGAFVEYVRTVMLPPLAAAYGLSADQQRVVVDATTTPNPERLRQFFTVVRMAFPYDVSPPLPPSSPPHSP